jgi:DNA adenine methylase
MIRYHGGKWMLAPWIIEHFPAHRVYVEPYGGAASVLLRKPRCYAEIYNELSDDVVNLLEVLRDCDRAARLREVLLLTPFSRTEFAKAKRVATEPVERARRLLVRSHMGFGTDSIRMGSSTGFRSVSNRSGTTPAHDWVNWPNIIEPFVARLQGVVIENRDAAICMRAHDAPHTLHYVDPPYLFSTRGKVTRRYAYEMTDEQHTALANVLRSLKGMVIVSGYPSPVYDELYTGWMRVERKSFADGANARTEVLWISPAAAHGRPLRLIA